MNRRYFARCLTSVFREAFVTLFEKLEGLRKISASRGVRIGKDALLVGTIVHFYVLSEF